MLKKMLGWLIFLTLFVHDTLTLDECIKDILVLWDNSYSVGSNFPEVIEFLKELIRSEKLNVGKEGTHLGFITFSNDDQTKELLEVGDKTEPQELIQWLDSLDYNRDLAGDQTFTGKAFKLANDVLKEPSPKNFRPNVSDIILLFTDGSPNPEYPESKNPNDIKQDQKRIADKYSTILKKNKRVTIIGLAGVKTENVEKFKPYVGNWSTSPEDVFDSKLDELDKVVDKMINASCMSAGYSGFGDPSVNNKIMSDTLERKFLGLGECPCGNVSTQVYTKRGSNATVKWLEPTHKCRAGQSSISQTEITPTGWTSGRSFEEGPYDIIYNYTYQNGNEKTTKDCHVLINVLPCDCSPNTQTVSKMVETGQTEAFVNWSKPEPNCSMTKPSPDNPQSTNRSFGVGEHTVKYKYTYDDQVHSFDMECRVDIVVTACKCPSVQTVNAQVELGDKKASVSWSEPVPTCPTTPSPSNPQSTSERLSVGNYTRTYNYNTELHSSEIQCHVNIVVTGEYCGTTAYDPATHICCCGKAHRKKYVAHKCCGTKYYNPSKNICCQEATLVARGGHCPN